MTHDPTPRIDHHFASLTDPRRARVTHPLINIVTIALCATIAGADDFVAMAGWALGPKVDWPWHKDYEGKKCAYVEPDATGVRRQGEGGGAAEGRMAYVGMACNPSPDWPWPDEKPRPMQARYLSGPYPLEGFAPLLRSPAGHVGMDQADRRIGLCDGGNGLEGRLREDFPRVEVIILDFFHPAEKPTGLARLLHPQDEDQAEDQARQWRGLLKDEGGAVPAAVPSEWGWPRRPGLSEAADALVGYLERQAHRMEYPEYLAKGWCIGSGAVESACKTVVGQRLKLAGMRWGEDGAHAVCHLRAPYRSEKGQWGASWRRDFSWNWSSVSPTNATPTGNRRKPGRARQIPERPHEFARNGLVPRIP